MKPQRRHVSIWFTGAKNIVLPQPKGVIGIVVPWNYPLFLGMGPVANALAAGNRCMVKMAANSQNLACLLDDLISQDFDKNTLAIIPGVSASEFTDVPYDHLVFTGSPEVGKKVMQKASQFLTPVTLELGGKSPTVIGEDFDVKEAVERIFQGKLYNAGQTCVAPDYVFVPEHKIEEFVEYAKIIVPKRYPELGTKDFTSIIDSKAFSRLEETLSDARTKGASVIDLLDRSATEGVGNKLSPHIILNAQDDMSVMQDEIFGPILPIKPYSQLSEVLEYINGNERPLALYLFSKDKSIQDFVIKNTLSGGVSLNDVMYHVAQHDLPFGGIGNSGMGHYHGFDGFVEFSKMRPILKQAPIAGTKLLAPPFGRLFNTLYKLMMKF
jgi:coniferyl-aldehyde dehydrogenase